MAGPLSTKSFKNLTNQAEKEVPQPQVSLALGLLKTNPLLLRPSSQSISIPRRYREWALSMKIRIPEKSYTVSLSFCSSKPRRYENPEQPPPLTPIRTPKCSGTPCSCRSRCSCLTAPGVREIGDATVVSVM